MKRTVKILLVSIVIILVAALVALQVWMKTSFAKILKEQVLPEGEKALGVEIAVGDASLNLLGGSLSFSELTIGNPEGFTEPRLFAVQSFVFDVGMLSLLRGVVDVADIDVKDMVLTVIRDRQGMMNLDRIRAAMEKQASAPPPAEPEAEAAGTQEMPRAILRRFAVDSKLEYVDYSLDKEPVRLGFRLSTEAADIATFGDNSDEWGTFSVRGHLDGKPDAFVTTIDGRIAPLTDPLKPSFDIKGSVASIDMRELGKLGEQLGVQTDHTAIDIDFKCRDNILQDGSMIRVTFENVRLVGDLAKKTAGLPIGAVIPKLSVPIRLSGPLDKPVLDNWMTAMGRAVTSTITDIGGALTNAAGSLLKDGTIQEKASSLAEKLKPDEKVKDTFKKLGDFLK